jgi:flagellar hook-basal body complex protein FliE
MRTITAQAQGVQPQHETQSVNFSEMLSKSINKVNDLQQTSGQLKTSFEMGDPKVSLAEVMIASEKSGLAFTAMTQVRNKLVEAYKEVMSMPV